MGNPVVHWEIGGHDLESLTTFYRELFGWESEGFDANYRLVNPGASIAGGLMRCTDDVPAYVTLYVAVDDLELALANAERLGGTRLVPPTQIPGVGWFAMFQDPEHNTIGLIRQNGADSA